MGNEFLEPLTPPIGPSFGSIPFAIVDTFTPYQETLTALTNDLAQLRTLSSTCGSIGTALETSYNGTQAIADPSNAGWTGTSATVFQEFMGGYTSQLAKSSEAFLEASMSLLTCVTYCTDEVTTISQTLSSAMPTLDSALRAYQDLQNDTSFSALTSTGGVAKAKSAESNLESLVDDLKGVVTRVNAAVDEINSAGTTLASYLNQAAHLSPHYVQYHAPSFWDDLTGGISDFFTGAWHFTEQFADGVYSVAVGLEGLVRLVFHPSQWKMLGEFAWHLVDVGNLGQFEKSWELLGSGLIDAKDWEDGDYGKALGNLVATVVGIAYGGAAADGLLSGAGKALDESAGVIDESAEVAASADAALAGAKSTVTAILEKAGISTVKAGADESASTLTSIATVMRSVEVQYSTFLGKIGADEVKSWTEQGITWVSTKTDLPGKLAAGTQALVDQGGTTATATGVAVKVADKVLAKAGSESAASAGTVGAGYLLKKGTETLTTASHLAQRSNQQSGSGS